MVVTTGPLNRLDTRQATKSLTSQTARYTTLTRHCNWPTCLIYRSNVAAVGSIVTQQEVMKTPQLADYLSLDEMYNILDVTNLVTKSSKKSSMKKTKSTPNLYQR